MAAGSAASRGLHPPRRRTIRHRPQATARERPAVAGAPPGPPPDPEPSVGLEGPPARSAVVHVRGGPPARRRTSSRSGQAAAAPGPGRGRWAAGAGRRWDERLAAPGRSRFPVRDRPAEAPRAPPPAPHAWRAPQEVPLPPGPELRRLRVAVQPQRSLPTRRRSRSPDPGRPPGPGQGRPLDPGHPPGPHPWSPAWPRQAVPRAPGRGRCRARAPVRPGSPGPTWPRPGVRRSGPAAAGGPGPSPGARSGAGPFDRRRSRAGSARPVKAPRYPGAPARRFARPGP